MQIDYKLLLRILSLVFNILQELPAQFDHRPIAASASDLITITALKAPKELPPPPDPDPAA